MMIRFIIDKILTSSLAVAVLFTACEEADRYIYKGESFASFNSGEANLTINPSEDTKNVFLIGVTAASSEDRTFTVSISNESTLDSGYYSLASETGIIPAGEFVGAIEITTFATLNFPPSNARLIFTLESVENTEFLLGGDTVLTLSPLVACAFDEEVSLGTYIIEEFEAGLQLKDTFEVIEGPKDGQIKLLNPLGHVNPTTGKEDFFVIVDVNPQTGAASLSKKYLTWDPKAVEVGPPDKPGVFYTDGVVGGKGYVFSCLESMEFSFELCVKEGCFDGIYYFKARKIK